MPITIKCFLLVLLLTLTDLSIKKTSALSNVGCPNINPLTSICCNGCIRSRVGMRQPACCGTNSFDAAFNLCCNGFIRPRGSYIQPACCGTNSYDANGGLVRCCNNSFISSTCTWWWWGK